MSKNKNSNKVLSKESEFSKNKLSKLKEKLQYETQNATKILDAKQQENINEFCCGYIDFLNSCKTERETIKYIKDKAVKNGYKKFVTNQKYKPGDKIYFEIKNKSIILSTIGQEDMPRGVLAVASHVDSPRIDLKTRPLYSESDLAIFKTHYYGGIKKYQWVTMPLALHGVVINKDMNSVDICIGEDDSDEVFCITDLLPHLDRGQDRSRMSNEIISGEQLNVIAGSSCFFDADLVGDVKLNMLRILNQKYNITEKDLISADLSFVPAFKAKNIGLDKSLIGGYGQDDKSCIYPSLISELETKDNKLTTVSIFIDREEVGSDGNTGITSDIIKNYLLMLCESDFNKYMECTLNSICLSADVKAAYDPTWSNAYEKYNCSYLNRGVCLTKYTGFGGKQGTSEASAELMRKIINMLDNKNIVWQTNLNKVDQGGGGTVAKFVAKLGIDVIDIGVPILSMHSPYEIASKLDIFMLSQAIKEFLNYKF